MSAVLQMPNIQGGGLAPSPLTPTQLRTELRRTAEALHGGAFSDTAEVRVLERSAAPWSGCFTDAATLADAAADVETKTRGGNLYITVNPVVPRAGMNTGRIQRARSGSAVADGDVARLRWLFFDLDPVRPTDTCATDAEKEQARVQTDLVRDHLASLGWSAPLRADSGNGFHLFYPLDLPNDEPSRQLVKAVTNKASDEFSSSSVKVDRSVSNPARITRMYGATNRKGPNTPERPWRRAALIDCPERVPLTVAQLQNYLGGAATATATPEGASTEPPHTSPEGQPMDWLGDAGLRFDMPAFLSAAGIKAKGPENHDGGQKWVLDACPFNPDHNRGEAAVFLDSIGAPGFNCFHDSCASNRGWAAGVRQEGEGAVEGRHGGAGGYRCTHYSHGLPQFHRGSLQSDEGRYRAAAPRKSTPRGGSCSQCRFGRLGVRLEVDRTRRAH